MKLLAHHVRPFGPWLLQAFIASLSFFVFSFLDCFDVFLCFCFQALDFFFDPEASPCYCERRHKSAPLLSSNDEELPVVESSPTSVTLYDRRRLRDPSFSRSVNHTMQVVRKWVKPIKQYGCEGENAAKDSGGRDRNDLRDRPVRTTTGRSLQRTRMFDGSSVRWSDCGCSKCTSWQSIGKELLYVHVEGKDVDTSKCLDKAHIAHSNVIFIHGFLSSSSLWTEKVIPNLPESTKESYRMYAVDLLGFGRSPKPRNCSYTMADHIEFIEISVLQRYKIDSFHLVAHSMGCIVALALAAAHADVVQTVTLLAPPYFPPPTDEPGAAYVLQQVAPRRIWPPIAFGASVMSWYEHVGRGICFILCRHHRLWEPIAKLLTLNSVSSFLIQDFMQHTHHSAWHIFHNVICGEAHALDNYLKTLERADCEIHVFHGREDRLVSIHCSMELHKRYPKVNVNALDLVNHFSIILGREKAFSDTLDNIWRNALVSRS